jgi:hypothetical protein
MEFDIVEVPIGANGWPVGQFAPGTARKYSDALVAEVRKAYQDGLGGRRRLSKIFGINTWTVRDWLRGKRRCTEAVRIEFRRVQRKRVKK